MAEAHSSQDVGYARNHSSICRRGLAAHRGGVLVLQSVLDALAEFPLFVGDDGRILLLANLPELSRTLVRSSSPLIDLATMVDTAASWGTPAQGRPALLVLIETALGLLVGSQAWQAVDSIRQELTTSTIRGQIFVGPPAAPHALILTPDGQQAFTWSTDEVLRRWDLAASTL